MEKQRVFEMKFSLVYSLLVKKAERKNRTKQEVDQIFCWFTGYDTDALQQQLQSDVAYRTFLQQAPCINPKSEEITGSICGVRIETIEDPVMKQIRRLDKLIDELAKGKKMEQILRN